ncbi:hypothetical protein H8B06_07650 [Sphingobacterium sp. DN00404]|uniref:Uncharacterized protein n=1 Tax=Sphingobacterium micropteri TaxID=2763501 RepID=A0ABR7YN02_9SPHI|nr:hypothetical protein [Sphingobacterium micropteri]MBD1432693.1 hypothetical protein [Sphingobacterium micropteri]
MYNGDYVGAMGHFGANYNAPKAPDWLSNKYVSGFSNIVAGHEIQNMQNALNTYQQYGFQAYIYITA